MDHVVSPARVLRGLNQEADPGAEHDGQHDWVSPVKWVLADVVGEPNQGHHKSHIQQRESVPLHIRVKVKSLIYILSVVVKQKVTILKLQ